MTFHGQQIIGRRRAAGGSDTFTATNPAAGAALEPAFHEATRADVDAAMELAAAAFEPYRALDSERRAVFLETIAEEILALGDALLERASAETALPPRPRLEMERGRTVNQLKMFASLIRDGSWVDARIDTAIPDRKPVPKPDLRRILMPLGPVVVFGASNFPLAYSAPGGDTASALAAGCPVVVKGHPAHPGTSELIAGAIIAAAERCGMPDGVFSLLQGKRNELSLALVEHQLTCAVGFTGSLRGGRALFDAAAKRAVPIPVYAEMGSVNPVFILSNALRERGDAIAAGLHQSVTVGVGQFCTNPGVVVAQKSEALDGFLQGLAERIRGTAPATMLHAGICKAYSEGSKRLASLDGVRQLATSETPARAEHSQAAAALFTTSADALLRNHDISEEVFGPSTVVVQADTAEQLETIARRLDGHLTATLHGTPEDLKQHRSLVRVLETKVGRLLFNDFPTGVEVCPSMQHGGPYPATTDSRTTSVGAAAILRFVRPIAYQNFPQDALPAELRDDNPRRIWRLINNQLTRESV